jgi:AraC-like DNA-binding protein
VADALTAASGGGPAGGPIDLRAVSAVREYLDAHPTEGVRAHLLERIAGLDRWTIARQFRAAFGTSPDRYRTMRRLGVARRAIAAGTPLAEAAVAAGFADQSHMTRQFKRTYGLTPTRWRSLTAAAPSGRRIVQDREDRGLIPSVQ